MPERRGILLLLLGMLGWIAAGFIGAAMTAAVIAFFGGLLHAWSRQAIAMPDALFLVLAGTAGFQTTLLFGALWQGRRAGGGAWRVGIGFWPVRRPRSVFWLCLLMFGLLVAFLLVLSAAPSLRALIRSVTPEILARSLRGSPLAIVARLGLIAVLAPVSEEFFFRGWLWEALWRRGCSPSATAVLTALPWLLLHGVDSPWRIVVLVPAAVVISLARYLGGSVRASLAVHMTNNGTAVLLQILAALFGHPE